MNVETTLILVSGGLLLALSVCMTVAVIILMHPPELPPKDQPTIFRPNK